MSKGVNKVILVGNLGADPEIRYTQDGNAIANINLATSEQWTDKHTGQKQEKTEWHRVVAFRRLAEIIGQYLHKGSKIYVEGKLQTRKWTDQQGVDRYTTEIIAGEMQMLDSRDSGNTGIHGQHNNQHASRGSYPQQNQSYPQPHAQPAPMPTDDFDDDIPF